MRAHLDLEEAGVPGEDAPVSHALTASSIWLASHRVSVIIPALNEAENLPYVLPRIPRWVHEVLLVDGQSTDACTTQRYKATTFRIRNADVRRFKDGRVRSPNVERHRTADRV